jgi:HSP20 family molecular chaperone IbpA
VHADLPGMKKEDIFVDFSQDGILTVAVTKNSEREQKEGEKVCLMNNGNLQWR